jgi:hypothetical protein
MIMAVLFLPVLFFDREKFFPAISFPQTLLRCKKLLPQNKKTHSAASGSEFFLYCFDFTNSPLAPYLGGTQNRNQYE